MPEVQMFPVFDCLSEEFLLLKKRDFVHRDGDWHRGIQANVIRKIGNSFEILVQVRSDTVDISKGKFDQSLATQMTDTDNLSEEDALHRGLLEELNLRNYIQKHSLQTNIRIIKTYDDEPNVLNREIISLYIVEVSPQIEVLSTSEKVQSLQWMEWNTFLQFFRTRKEHFTKTARFYFEHEEIRSMIGVMSHRIINKDALIQSHLSDQLFLHVDLHGNEPITYTVPYKSISQLQKNNMHPALRFHLQNQVQSLEKENLKNIKHIIKV